MSKQFFCLATTTYNNFNVLELLCQLKVATMYKATGQQHVGILTWSRCCGSCSRMPSSAPICPQYLNTIGLAGDSDLVDWLENVALGGLRVPVIE